MKKLNDILMYLWFITAPLLTISRFAILNGYGKPVIYYLILFINVTSGFGFLILENGSGMK